MIRDHLRAFPKTPAVLNLHAAEYRAGLRAFENGLVWARRDSFRYNLSTTEVRLAQGLKPGSKDEAYQRPAKTLPRSKGHHSDWLDACKGGKPASANFEYGAALTEVGLLGLVALRLGKKMYWDAKAMKATNAPAADAFLKESYHPGWEVT